MPLKDIRDQLHSGILFGTQTSAHPVDSLKVEEIEQLIGLKIPDWYFAFLDEYGVIACSVADRFALYSFDIEEMHGFIQDYCLDHLEQYAGMLPIGNDMGGLVLYYSERGNRPGIYMSFVYPEFDPELIYYVAPDSRPYCLMAVPLNVMLMIGGKTQYKSTVLNFNGSQQLEGGQQGLR